MEGLYYLLLLLLLLFFYYMLPVIERSDNGDAYTHLVILKSVIVLCFVLLPILYHSELQALPDSLFHKEVS